MTAKVSTLGLNLQEWPEPDSWEIIPGYMAQPQAIEKDVQGARRLSYNAAAGRGGKGQSVAEGPHNKHMHRSAGSAVLTCTFIAVPAPGDVQR